MKDINKVNAPHLGTNDNLATLTYLEVDNFSKVSKGEIICNLETTKTNFEIQSEYDGYVYFLFEIGSEISESDEIAVISPDLDSLKNYIEKMNKDISDKSDVFIEVNATNKAKALAEKLNIDISKIRLNRIIKESDILKFSNVNEAKDEIIELIGNKKLSKNLMLESKKNIPHSYIEIPFNVSMVEKNISLIIEKEQKYLTLLSIIIFSTAKALEENQLFNAYRDDERIIINKRLNIGIVIDNNNDISVPTIGNPNEIGSYGIAENLLRIRKDLLKKKPNLDDYQDGTFTISSLEHTRVKRFVPIIHPGQSAILAVPAIYKQYTGHDQEPMESIINFGLSFDHTFLNAAMANNFLIEIERQINLTISGLVK